MADDKTRPPGSITKTADSSDERIAEVSNVNRAISQMQRKVNQQLTETEADIGDVKGIEEVQRSMSKVLSTLSGTIGSIGYGFAKIAGSTAQASTDAVRQYGKAISEDISINKQNVVAMALSRTSPIFGYFVSQFMKTDVFQNAKEKMKANIASTIGDVTSKFKEGVGDLFRRSRTKKEKPLAEKAAEAVPKMQTGGYVEKAGMAYLHPAEVVVPIEKILTRIDESIAISKELANITRKTQIRSLAKMSTYVETTEKFERVGIVKGFLRAIREVQTEYQEPSDKRMLRAMLAIQDSLGATVGTWPQVWQKMLVEHPLFRNLMMASKAFSKVFGMPFKLVYSIFKARGGYQAHLSHARNPMVAVAENVGLVYSEGMWRLDNIAIYTRATAEATRDISSAITGKEYSPLEGVPKGIWSILGLARGLTSWATKTLFKVGGTFSKFLLGSLFKQKELAEWTDNFANQIGAVLTKRIEPLSRTWRIHKGLKRKDIYGTGTRFISELPKEMQDVTKRIGALPVSEIHLEEVVERMKGYMTDNKKHQQKLLTYTANMNDVIEADYEVTEDMNQREKRRSVFGFLGGGFGAVKSLLGAGGILPFLVSGASRLFASLTGSIVGGLTRVWTKLFPIVTAGLTTFLSSPVLWGAIAAAAAGAIGLAIGTVLDKLLGISRGFQAALTRADEAARKASEIETKMTTEKFKRARGGGRKGFESLEHVRVKGGFSAAAQERMRDVGWAGRHNLLAIETAQRSYMDKNINEYLKYGPEQITSLRSKWLKEGGYYGKSIGRNAEEYGMAREDSFLKFMQKEGKPLSEIEREQSYQAYASKYYDKYGLKERAGGVYMDITELAKGGISGLGTGIKAVGDDLKKLGEKGARGAKELGLEITNVVSQGTNIISSTVQNTSSSVNGMGQKTRDIFSEYDFAVIRGDIVGEDF